MVDTESSPDQGAMVPVASKDTVDAVTDLVRSSIMIYVMVFTTSMEVFGCRMVYNMFGGGAAGGGCCEGLWGAVRGGIQLN